MTNGKLSPSNVLAFLAETLQDSPQETPYTQTLASLHELYNKLAESFLLPSAFPEKNNVQQRVQIVFGQMDFLAFFPEIIEGPLHCLIGLSPKERTLFLNKQSRAIPVLATYNESIPTFFIDGQSPAFFVSGHGRKQRIEKNMLHPLLDSIFLSRIELRRLFSALRVCLPDKITKGTIADFPKYALSESRFLSPAIHLANTIVISLRNKDNRQLVVESFNAIAERDRPARVYVIGDEQYIPRHCSHIETIHCNTVDDIDINESEAIIQPVSILYTLMAPLLQFSAWITVKRKDLMSRINDLTNDIVMSREDINEFGNSLKELRQELSGKSQLYKEMKENVDQYIKEIWNKGKSLENILNSVDRNFSPGKEISTSGCPQLLYPDYHFSAQEECFIQLLCADQIEQAHALSHEMCESGYQHAKILELYLAEKNKQEFLSESLLYLGSYAGKNPFLLRAIVHFRLALHINDEIAGAIMQLIPRQTADEYYVHGMWLLSNHGEKEEGLKELRISLAMGDSRAGKALLEHWDNDIKTLRFLSKCHVAEANYAMGKSMIHSPSRDTQLRGWTELKISAALGNMSAIEEIANNEYWIVVNARKIKDKQDSIVSEKEKDRVDSAADNAKFLFQYLLENNAASQKSISNYGAILYYNKDFINALHVLKNCSESRAQMCCGRMYEYGDGVAQDLEKAKTYYKNAADSGDKIAPKKIESVAEKIERNKVKKQSSSKASYGKCEESRSSSTTSSGWCFITTATCLALGKPDDCEELIAFRKFRDNYLAKTPNGKATIDEYYAIAPDIISRIDKYENSNAIYNKIWEQYLQHAYACIIAGDNEKAKILYTDMVQRLRQV